MELDKKEHTVWWVTELQNYKGLGRKL